MSYVRDPIDYDTLPEAMLPEAKAYLRVLYADEDALITALIRQAISHFERLTGYLVFGSTVEWIPAPYDAVGTSAYWSGYQSAWALPVCPVASFTASDGADTPADISAQFALFGASSPGAWVRRYLSVLPGQAAPAYGFTATLIVGFVDLTTLPPGVASEIYRLTAVMYRDREQGNIEGVDTAPYSSTLLGGHWAPRC